MKRKETPYIYGMTTISIKSLSIKMAKLLKMIFNRYLKQDVFARILKTAKLLNVFKEGDDEDPLNYRPISILPSEPKILEEIIKIRILNYLEGNEIIG